MVIMDIFKFIDAGENLGTRMLGAQVRMRLLPVLQANEKTVLDFTGVNVVSNSFADECLGKILLEMPFTVFKSKTTFVGLNDFAKKNIAVALRRRLASLQ